jgi:hypothetical protein
LSTIVPPDGSRPRYGGFAASGVSSRAVDLCTFRHLDGQLEFLVRSRFSLIDCVCRMLRIPDIPIGVPVHADPGMFYRGNRRWTSQQANSSPIQLMGETCANYYRRWSTRKTKQVLRLRFDLGPGQRTIARACFISQSTVMNIVKRSRYRLAAERRLGRATIG